MTLPNVDLVPGGPATRLRRFPPGSLLLIVILAALSVGPVVVLSCAGVAPVQQVTPVERPTFTAQPKVRVALAVRTRGGVTLPVKVTGGYLIVDPRTTTVLVRGARLSQSPVEALANGIVISVPDAAGGKKVMHLPRIRIVPVRSGTLHVGGRRYRGVLDMVYVSGGRMTLVNELDLEDYVGGVVPAEMFYYWPREALRAQAVVTRTYALALVMENDRTRPRPEYDLEADYLTGQVYKGMGEERAKPLEAVNATRGLVLTHKGNVFRAYFHACCGGHTEACGLLWDDYATIPPLAGQTCDYCKRSKWYNWHETIPLLEIEDALRHAGTDLGKLHDVQFTDTNSNGHADEVTSKGSRGSLRMKGNYFRLALVRAYRAGLIKTKLLSMNFESRSVQGGYELTGHGWGHGCGMCQYGAKGMAELLKSYDKILEYYYPETQLWKVY